MPSNQIWRWLKIHYQNFTFKCYPNIVVFFVTKSWSLMTSINIVFKINARFSSRTLGIHPVYLRVLYRQSVYQVYEYQGVSPQ